MSRPWAIFLALLLLAVPLFAEAACDDCAKGQLGAFCATCALCLCCGGTWATRPELASTFLLRPCGVAFDLQLTQLPPPTPREILHVPRAGRLVLS